MNRKITCYILFPFLFFSCCVYTTIAQNTWHKTYQNNSNISDVLQSGDGSFAAVGQCVSTIPNDVNLMLVKADSLGNPLWVKQYGDPGLKMIAESICEVHDGGFLIGGHTGLNGSFANLIRVNSNGNIIWMKNLQDTANSFFSSVIETSDSGFLALGSDNNSMILVKLDSAGATQWIKLYEDCWGWSLIKTYNGYAIFGKINNDMLLMKIDEAGDTTLVKRYGYPSTGRSFLIKQTPDSGFIMNGPITLRTDSLGDILWSRTYFSQNPFYFHGIELTNSGYIIAGHDIDIFDDYGFALFIDFAGNISHNYRYEYTASQLSSVRRTSDGGFVFAASLKIPQVNGGMIKTNLQGNSGCNQLSGSFTTFPITVPVYSAGITLSTFSPALVSGSLQETSGGSYSVICSSVSVEETNEPQLSIFPNPALNQILVESNVSGYSGLIEVFNALGEKQYTSVFGGKAAVSCASFSPGIYYVKVTTNSRTVLQKFLKH